MDDADVAALKQYAEHLDTAMVHQDERIRRRVRFLLDALATAQRERDQARAECRARQLVQDLHVETIRLRERERDETLARVTRLEAELAELRERASGWRRRMTSAENAVKAWESMS